MEGTPGGQTIAFHFVLVQGSMGVAGKELGGGGISSQGGHCTCQVARSEMESKKGVLEAGAGGEGSLSPGTPVISDPLQRMRAECTWCG